MLSRISSALKRGSTAEVSAMTRKALEAGFEPSKIIDQSLIPAMEEVGRLFKDSNIFIPEVMMASRAMQAGLRVLRESFPQMEPKKPVRVLIGTVAGDLHDIGKSLVAMYLQACGCEVINLGIDVPTDEFVWGVRKRKPQVLAMSALLTTTMPAMEETIEALEKNGLRKRVAVIVGGGPVSERFAEEIGADSYAYDARAATDWVRRRFSDLI